MPELPEVETMVRDLRDRIVGSRVLQVETYWDRIVGHPTPVELSTRLRGRSIAAVRRRGKFALLDLDDGSCLAFHRGMTGSLLLRQSAADDDRFVRARLRLGQGMELRFDDARKFGRIFLVGPSESWDPPWNRLGPEPLSDEFTAAELATRLRKRKVAVKTALLNQTIVAGVGNIYADEALFAAAVLPLRPAGSLSLHEVGRLYEGVRSTLRAAIDGRGTTFSTYRDIDGESGANQHRLMVFQRQPGPCLRCGGEILRVVVGGRGTHFCRSCQT